MVVGSAPMKPWRCLAPLLAGVILALAPLAEASPPDQTWIAGVYDNSDYDDAVLAVIATVASLALRPLPDTQPARIVVAFISQIDESVTAVVTPLSNHARPPPVS